MGERERGGGGEGGIQRDRQRERKRASERWREGDERGTRGMWGEWAGKGT